MGFPCILTLIFFTFISKLYGLTGLNSESFGIDSDRVRAYVNSDGDIILPGNVKLGADPGDEKIGIIENSDEKYEARRSIPRQYAEHCLFKILAPVPTQSNGSDIFESESFTLTSSSPPRENWDVPGCYYKTPDRVDLICSSENMTALPTRLPNQLDTLELTGTSVNTIPPLAFNQKTIKMIKMNKNSIDSIHTESFYGMHGLLYLSIEGNNLSYITLDIFSSLNELVVLVLKDNKIELRDPPEANFTILPQLTYLNLAHNPLKRLGKNVFTPLSGSKLEELNLQGCSLEYIDPAAFLPLTNLRHVDLFDNPALIGIFDSLGPSLPSVRQIGLGFNMLERIPSAFLQRVSRIVTSLNLARNSFFRLTNETFPVMARLSTLILEGCGIAYIESGAFLNLPKLSNLYIGRNRLTQLPPALVIPSLRFLSLRENPDQEIDGGVSFNMNEGFQLSSLNWLDMNYMKVSEIRRSAFNNLTGLSILQMRGSNIPKVYPGAFESQSVLRFLDLGENYDIDIFSDGVFFGLYNLTSLFLDQCYSLPIDKQKYKKPKNFTTILSPLGGLKRLYLGHNGINNTDSSLLKVLHSLEVLDLHGNDIIHWTAGTLTNESSLKALDLSMNHISFLEDGTHKEFAHLEAINLAENPFVCDCGLNELHLIAQSSGQKLTRWNDSSAYVCISTSDATRQNIQEGQDFACRNAVYVAQTDMVTVVSVSSVTAFFVFIIIVSVTYFNRYNIRKLLNSRKHKESECYTEYEYDAFVSYSENDRLWIYERLVPNLERHEKIEVVDESEETNLQYRLCLHDRDFVAGQKITDNIIQAISKSKKVIIVLSRSYIQSQWCLYEVDLATQMINDEGRGSVVIVVLEKVPLQELPRNIRYLMRTRTYLQWSNDVDGQKIFFKRFAQILGDPVSEFV